ncbi:MAG: stimulus-sensing domain-containing protein [Alphaproteobacteria bacterium]|nr:stimulus-sensing domain-containing protein [Alphaproteobacteria bacterium]MBV9152066.1 stimulus-sensing domain-containing protein [Alphaproteobacteria bacterium]MBV9965604.1 stimulus-sensing domain-containing protein [Alphaproteobacteria bacterium]
MASVIDTATADPNPGPEPAPEASGGRATPAEDSIRAQPHSTFAAPGRAALIWLRRFRWRTVSPLTRRIIAVNVLPLALLAVGFLYLGKFESSLVGQQIESLHTQGEIFAAALSEGAVLDSGDEGEILLPDLARQMMRRLVEPTRTRARLFDINGKQIADSRLLRGPGDAVQVMELPSPEHKGLLPRLTDQIYDWITELLPSRHKHPAYRENDSGTAEDYGEAMRALHGESASAVRSDPQTGGLVVSVAVPVQRYKQVLGAVMLSSPSGEIEEELRTVRFELLRMFGIALLVTVLLSLYLAGTIARPIRRLAGAAERARGRGARVEIPDLMGRGDEIGELSRSLREMTDALWQRMSAIESFAADVAHELKNPLSSLRSAVETAARIEDPVKRRRLMAIIQDDVERLDRLISDISDASRLDAELSRQEVSPTDIGAMLGALAEMHETTRADGAPHLVLEIADRGRDLIVPGIESRLSQVFINVIANAASFSPLNGEIRIRASLDGRAVLVCVEDEGPGIPEDKLTAIFDRFYSERPAGEKFGTHSGLGLSISKQIIEAHRGRIWAENRTDADGTVIGARFLVRLPATP